MTHDLLKSMMETLGGTLKHIVVNDLREEVYYAELIVDVNGSEITIDSRPSDAIALAVRADVPIFVAESVMERAASTPDEEITEISGEDIDDEEIVEEAGDDLDIFADFVDTLGLDDLGDEEEDD
jgi:bifunctional DNase/RNase